MSFASSYQKELLVALDAIDLAAVERAVEWLHEARDTDHQVFVCGNGGSAATASHFVCDMVKGAVTPDGRRFRILSLNESIATITAYSNDLSYEFVFVEQLKNLANRGDVFVALSGSGNSRNLVRAMEYALAYGLKTVALTGRGGGKLATIADLNIQVADAHMGRIEDCHMAVCHMIAYALMDPHAGLPPVSDAIAKTGAR